MIEWDIMSYHGLGSPSELARQASSLDTKVPESPGFFEKSGVSVGAFVIAASLVGAAYLMWQDGKGGPDDYEKNGRRRRYRRNHASIPMFWVGSGKKRDRKWVAV